MVIDFDDASTWEPELAARLQHYVPARIRQQLCNDPPEYVDDAWHKLRAAADGRALIEATLQWIRENTVAAYHGTRLAAQDEAAIRRQGLRPLVAEERRSRLVRALECHPSWLEISGQLDAVLVDLGADLGAGQRVGQVHLTLSRAALVDEFNHYLAYGSEFDQHACRALLGKDGLQLLARDGAATVLRVEVPGVLALRAAHSIFSIEDVLAKGSTPNIVRELLTVWSYRLAYPAYLASKFKPDCGLRFDEVVPSAWITAFERVEVGPHVSLRSQGDPANRLPPTTTTPHAPIEQAKEA